MSFLLEFLPIVIYLLLIIVLIIGIILGIKTIITLNKVEHVVDNVNDKVQTLNGFFHIIDFTTDKIALATDKVVEGITNFVTKLLFSKKKNKEKESDEENE
jgi:uncharacterized protein YoxC